MSLCNYTSYACVSHWDNALNQAAGVDPTSGLYLIGGTGGTALPLFFPGIGEEDAAGLGTAKLFSRLGKAGKSAESAGNPAPQLNKAFQFGGAGRSGAAAKNFVGPENAVVRGASQGRVFVTDSKGRVIMNITRDRVKPVVPGQGYVAGDGRKLAPTQEQRGWIDELWGG